MTPRNLAGLLVLACLSLSPAAAGADDVAPTKVSVVLANFRFTPEDLQLPADTPVTLNFVNEGSGGRQLCRAGIFRRR